MKFQILMKSLSLGGRNEGKEKSEIIFAAELLPATENFGTAVCCHWSGGESDCPQLLGCHLHGRLERRTSGPPMGPQMRQRPPVSPHGIHDGPEVPRPSHPRIPPVADQGPQVHLPPRENLALLSCAPLLRGQAFVLVRRARPWPSAGRAAPTGHVHYRCG